MVVSGLESPMTTWEAHRPVEYDGSEYAALPVNYAVFFDMLLDRVIQRSEHCR